MKGIGSRWKTVGGFHGVLLLSAKQTRSFVWWENTVWLVIRRTIQRTNNSVWLDGGISPFFCQDLSWLHKFDNKVLPGIFLGFVLYAGRIWKGDIVVSDIDELERMDASEIHTWRLNAVLTPKSGEMFFPIADGTVKLPGGDQDLRTSTWIWQVSELHFDKFLTSSTFLKWKVRFKNQATTCSDFSSETMLWINEVEMLYSLDELKSSRSINGKIFPTFEVLDARIASALNQIIQNSHFKKKVTLEEPKAQKEDGFLRGRQINVMIYDYFRVTGVRDTVLDYADLFSVTLLDDNIQEFDTRWDEVLLSMSKIPSDNILESLCKLRLRESHQLITVLELYDMEIHQKISVPNYQKLKTMIKRSIDQKLRLRNFDARHGNIETGALVQSRKGLSWKRKLYMLPVEIKRPVFEGRPVEFPAWEYRSCTKTDTESRSTLWASKYTRSKFVVKTEASEAEVRPCRFYLKGTCTRSRCEYWHPPECQFYKTESGCKAWHKCLFPHYMVDEQPKKKHWEYVSLISSKPYWNSMTWKFIRNSDCETLTPEMKNWHWNSGYESQGSTWCWKRTRSAINGKQKGQCSRGNM